LRRSGACGRCDKARTAAINQLKGLLVTAPSSLREDLDQLPVAALVATCARLRPDEAVLANPVHATRAALGVVACRIPQPDEELAWSVSGWPRWSATPRPG
jgi:transposase